MANIRFLLVPDFIWSLSNNSRCGTTIQDMYKCSQTLSPKFLRQTRFIQQCNNPFGNSAVSTFSYTILLWPIPASMLPYNPTFIQIGLELFGHVFATLVISKALHFLSSLILGPCFKCLECFKSITFLLERDKDLEPSTVINK